MQKHKWYNEIVAWASGAEIEIRFLNSRNIWGNWHSKKTPQWDTSEKTEYRIKPTPKLVPFDFSDAEKLIGKVVKDRDGIGFYIVGSVNKKGVTIVNNSSLITYHWLLSLYTFIDGSPCGKYVNE